MSWQAQARDALGRGHSVTVRPRGHSMTPRITSGARVTLEPVEDPDTLRVGDVVFYKVRGVWYLHRISAIQGDRVQIANQRGRVNGWAGRRAVLGRATRIDNL